MGARVIQRKSRAKMREATIQRWIDTGDPRGTMYLLTRISLAYLPPDFISDKVFPQDGGPGMRTWIWGKR